MCGVVDKSEQSLVQELRERSQHAFEELVRKYTQRLYSVSFSILRNKQDAEDAVQETFLKAFLSIDSFQGKAALFTWLYRIVANQSLMKVRERSKRRVVDIETYLPHFQYGQHTETIRDWSKFPELALRTKELQEFFERCVDELPEEYRLAYILKDVERLSEEDVCQILELSKPTMKNRVHRARLVIRKRIEENFLNPV